MSRVYDFLKQNGMIPEASDWEAMEEAFLLDMKEVKSIDMLDSYQKAFSGELPPVDILAVDAGGTNLRFAEYRGGKLYDENKMHMPGIEKEISSDEFFGFFAEQIEKYPEKYVNFCFSYQCSILPTRDGRIIDLSKEVKVKDIAGKVIGEEINKRLSAPRCFSVLNDTVAAQLGTGSDLAIILGTGFNVCYTSRTTGTIINTECGKFNAVPKGRFDYALNGELGSTAEYSEKLISGAYIGKLIQITAREYFGREMPDFELREVSEFLIGEGPLYDFFTTAEKIEFREIIALLLSRACTIVALMLKCIATDLAAAGDRVRVALEGSTVYKLPGYLPELKNRIEELSGLDFELIDARGKILLGCVGSTLGME